MSAGMSCIAATMNLNWSHSLTKKDHSIWPAFSSIVLSLQKSTVVLSAHVHFEPEPCKHEVKFLVATLFRKWPIPAAAIRTFEQPTGWLSLHHRLSGHREMDWDSGRVFELSRVALRQNLLQSHAIARTSGPLTDISDLSTQRRYFISRS